MPKHLGLKRAFLSFLFMVLAAASFGLGLYYFTKIEWISALKNLAPLITIPDNEREENTDDIKVLLMFHAADYFVYRGMPIGFQYELLKEMEKGIGRTVEITIEENAEIIKNQIFANNFDIVATNAISNGFLAPFIERSIPHSYSYPILVGNLQPDSLSEKTIYVSSYFSGVLFFEDQSIYKSYKINKVQQFSSEELFEKVANNEISYMICDYNEAITLLPFYSGVKLLDKAGPQFDRRWYLKKRNKQLNDEINHWLLDFKKTAKYLSLVRKYFSPSSSLINASFAKNSKNGLSNYDAIIKKYATHYELDWRFIASIIYQETKFISGLTGKGGSYGLMQLMPVTMDYYGISEEDSDETQIQVGIQHIHSIRKSFSEIEDEYEKMNFVAASYNAGRGHIFDAQKLCAKYGKDYTNWKDVAEYLKLKSQREYATDSVVRSGYFPGSHTVKYTQQVMERYDAYRVMYQ